MLSHTLPLIPGLSLAPGSIASASRLLGAGLAASTAHANGAAVVSPSSCAGHRLPARTPGRWIREITTYAPGQGASANQHNGSEAKTKPRPHEELHPPPTSLKAGGSFAAGAVAPHPGLKADVAPTKFTESHMPHPAYTTEYLESVRPTHLEPEKFYQHVGLRTIQLARWLFDRATGYSPHAALSDAQWLRRIIFLETVAGVPGMVAGMVRHLKSLRTMQRDHGWIHTLLEEAENERMHLITFLELRNPGPLFRAAVIAAQGIFFNAYFIAYLLSPRTCHAFVGFLEEEAVKTYTHALAEINAGRLWRDRPAPRIAVQYWGLPKHATMRDLILAVRADEACHAHVNHTFSKIPANLVNPFATGASQLP